MEVLLSTVIQARDLSRSFGRRWAYARVDLEVAAGERLLVVGANGSGKTTLLRTFATLLRPSLGELRLFGKDPQADLAAVREKIALFSHQSGLYEDLSARENLAIFAGIFGKKPDIPALLREVGLEDRADPVRRYSAGMRRRVALALLLLKQPALALLDEPFSALDPSGIQQVSALIERLPGTVLVVSHQIEQAAALCQRAVLLSGGLLRWSGPALDAGRAWQAIQRASA